MGKERAAEMEIRRRFSPPQEANDVTPPAAMAPVPVLTISLSIPLPMVWPRQRRSAGHRLPADAALSCIELAFGDSGRHLVGPRLRRVARRGAMPLPRQASTVPASATPSFAMAMREGHWWQAALAGLERRTRRLHMIRFLPL